MTIRGMVSQFLVPRGARPNFREIHICNEAPGNCVDVNERYVRFIIPESCCPLTLVVDWRKRIRYVSIAWWHYDKRVFTELLMRLTSQIEMRYPWPTTFSFEDHAVRTTALELPRLWTLCLYNVTGLRRLHLFVPSRYSYIASHMLCSGRRLSVVR
jgi:hypothetical protein